MTKRSDAEPFEGFDLIHSYSRQQAIEDGVLVDVTATAREAGGSGTIGRRMSVPAQPGWPTDLQGALSHWS